MRTVRRPRIICQARCFCVVLDRGDSWALGAVSGLRELLGVGKPHRKLESCGRRECLGANTGSKLTSSRMTLSQNGLEPKCLRIVLLDIFLYCPLLFRRHRRRRLRLITQLIFRCPRWHAARDGAPDFVLSFCDTVNEARDISRKPNREARPSTDAPERTGSAQIQTQRRIQAGSRTSNLSELRLSLAISPPRSSACRDTPFTVSKFGTSR